MQQDHDRRVSGAFIDDIEHKLTAAVLLDALRMRPRRPVHRVLRAPTERPSLLGL